MKRDDLRKLILRLRDSKIDEELLEQLLNNEEILLKELLDIDNEKLEYAIDIIMCDYYDSSEYKLESIHTLKQIDKYISYIGKLFTNKITVKSKIAIEGAKIVNSSKEEAIAFYVNYVLTNKDAVEAGIALEGAKIVSESKQEYNAELASYVLTNDDAIKAGIALEGAKIINESKQEYNAEYASCILTDKELIEAGVSVKCAKIVNQSKEEYNAKCIYKVYDHIDLTNPKLIFEVFNFINSLNEEQTKYIEEISDNLGKITSLNNFKNKIKKYDIYEEILKELDNQKDQNEIDVKKILRKIRN